MPADRPIRSDEDLVALFHESEKPDDAWRIGTESEKIGLLASSGAPLPYLAGQDARGSVEQLFQSLQQQCGYQPYSESAGGPVIALRRGALSLTLEPGAQVELSGAPCATVHEVAAETAAHFGELVPISDALGIEWLGIGFHPTARRDELPWVPKQRYPIMREYLPRGGARALDMMQRTATVQVNLDFSSEHDALRKMRVALRLSPVIHTMTANSPFIEGRVSDKKSERGDVWLHMPKDRSGLLEPLWREGPLGYRDYVEWALDAGMFLFKRGERTFHNTGQPFREFLRDGFQGEHAMFSDWALHLTTLFPEARLKSTLELRSCDALDAQLMNSIPALYAGLLYDPQALALAEELAEPLQLADVQRARPRLLREGLRGHIGATSVQHLAERVLDIAEQGLARRARRDEAGRDETHYLRPLTALIQAGKSPADRLCEGLQVGSSVAPEILRQRARLLPQ